jgi:hypothetical protein
MFNLEKAISDWRRQMLSAGIKTPVPLKELESHLREEIERHVKSGLDGQQTFEIAIQKIGKADLLNDEFQKVHGAKEMRDWKLKQILFASSLSAISLIISPCLLFKIGSLKEEITPAQQLSGLAALGVMILFAVGGRLSCGFLSVIFNKRIRDTICSSGGVRLMLWLTVFFNFVLPRADYLMCQLFVTILRAVLLPFGIFGGLIAGIEAAAWKNSGRDSSASRN